MEVKMEVKRYAQDMCIVNLYRPLLLPLCPLDISPVNGESRPACSGILIIIFDLFLSLFPFPSRMVSPSMGEMPFRAERVFFYFTNTVEPSTTPTTFTF